MGLKGYSIVGLWLALSCIPLSSAFIVRPASSRYPARAAPTREGLMMAEALAPELQRPQVEFPEPLTSFDRAQRAVTFWSQVVPIIANYALLKRKIQRQRTQLGESFTAENEQEMWNEAHAWGSTRLAETIKMLKGFYVKTGQIMSTRVDMFPQEYTSKLQMLQDSLDPISTDLVKALISKELLEDEPIETLFKEFDDEPLGSASIAQVHRAVLLDGREVAVKVQRPAEEPKLRADIQNLKAFALRFRESLPVDYYPVFCELERALANELDFLAEAQSIEKIAASVSHTIDGKPSRPPVFVPRPIPGLVSKRVLVMEFVKGIPLNRLKEKMEEKGIAEGSPEAKIVGTRLLSSLTEAFSRQIFGSAFVHGDPHPGNIFIMEGGRVSLIDCGQVKQISITQKLRLAQLVTVVSKYNKPNGSTVKDIAAQVQKFGVAFEEGVGEDCAAAVAILLFGETGIKLPGNYSSSELSAESPLRKLKLFPQELVLVGRATVLIKGIASRLGVPWNLAEKFADAAKLALECGEDGCMVPVYASTSSSRTFNTESSEVRPKFSEVKAALRSVRDLISRWVAGKTFEVAPERVKKFLMNREARKMSKQEKLERELSSGVGEDL